MQTHKDFYVWLEGETSPLGMDCDKGQFSLEKLSPIIA
jgi:hypothetical protein